MNQYAYLLGVFRCQSHRCITETGAPPTLVPQNILFHRLQISTVPYIHSHQCLNFTARTISLGSYISCNRVSRSRIFHWIPSESIFNGLLPRRQRSWYPISSQHGHVITTCCDLTSPLVSIIGGQDLQREKTAMINLHFTLSQAIVGAWRAESAWTAWHLHQAHAVSYPANVTRNFHGPLNIPEDPYPISGFGRTRCISEHCSQAVNCHSASVTALVRCIANLVAGNRSRVYYRRGIDFYLQGIEV